MELIDLEMKFENALSSMPIVAILRGVSPDDVVSVALEIYAAGIRIIEVPLNTPRAFECIDNLSSAMSSPCIVGCGTLTEVRDIPKLVEVGAQLAVTPSTQVEVIQACLKSGLLPMPGFMTPTEAFRALQAGAKYLKLFPASTGGVTHLKAIQAVLPKQAKVLAVGGVKPAEFKVWQEAGAIGFGFASDIYKMGLTLQEVGKRANAIVAQYRDQ